MKTTYIYRFKKKFVGGTLKGVTVTGELTFERKAEAELWRKAAESCCEYKLEEFKHVGTTRREALKITAKEHFNPNFPGTRCVKETKIKSVIDDSVQCSFRGRIFSEVTYHGLVHYMDNVTGSLYRNGKCLTSSNLTLGETA